MSSPSPVRPDRQRLYLLGMLALITLLTVWGLGRESLSLDEGVTAIRVEDPWRRFWLAVSEWEPNFALYYLLMRGWTAIAGTSEIALRAPSVVFIVAAAPFIYATFTRLFGPRAGLAALFFYGLNPFVIRQAQDARPYALVVLLVSAGAYLFVLTVRTGGLGAWLGWTVVSCAALYAHPFTILATGAQVVTLVVLKPRPLSLGRLALSSIAIGAAAIPLARALLPNGAERIRWIPEADPGQVATAAAVLSGGTIPWLLIYLIAGMAMVWLAVRERSRGPEALWPYVYVLGWVVLPMIVLYAISHLYVPVFLDRYLVIVLPALAATGGVAITKLPSPWLTVGAAALVVAITVPPLVEIHGSDLKADWRQAARIVAHDARAGDVIIVYPRGVDPFRHYYRRYDGDPSIAVYNVDAVEDHTKYPALLGSHDRVWLLLHDDVTPAPSGGLMSPLSDWTQRDSLELNGMSLRLLEEP